jgi:hypothetical protein
VRSEIVKVIADVDDEEDDPDRHDAVETLKEWSLSKHRADEDPYGIKWVRLDMVDWYAVVDALED